MKTHCFKAVLLSILLHAPAVAQTGPDSSSAPPPLTLEQLRRKFEEAFADPGSVALSRLVREHRTQVSLVFEQSLLPWIERDGEPNERVRQQLDLARALAVAVAEQLDLGSMLELVETCEEWDGEARATWKTARQEMRRGVALHDRHQWSSACEPLESAVDRFASLGWSLGEAEASSYLGNCLSSLHDYLGAIRRQQRALEVYRAIEDQPSVATCLMNLGNAHDALGENETALEYHRQALALREARGNPSDTAQSLMNLANCLHSLCEYEQAIACHERALALLERLGDRAQLATTLMNLGNCRQSVGDYQRSIEHYERALKLFEGTGEENAMAALLVNIGTAFFHFGQAEKALAYHERGLELSARIGDLLNQARCLGGIGLSCATAGQHQRALEYERKALELFERIGSKREIGGALVNMGICLSALGQHQAAIECHERALHIHEQAGNRDGAAASLEGLANGCEKLEQFERAIASHEHALSLRESGSNPEQVALILDNLSRCLRLVGDYETALATLVRCTNEVCNISTRTLTEDGRSGFLAEWSALPDNLSFAAAHVTSRAALGAAFAALESLLGRGLVDEIQQRAQGIAVANDPVYGKDRDALLEAMKGKRLILLREVSGPARAERIQSLAAELKAAERALDELEYQFRRKHPTLAELKSPAPATLHDIQGRVLAGDELLLRYVVGDSTSYLWVVTPGAVRVHVLGASRAIREQVEALRLALTTADEHSLAFIPPARKLYQLLIEPVQDLVTKQKTLIVVPDGCLAYLPFEVLLKADPPAGEPRLAELDYVIRERVVRYAPSPSFLVFLAGREAADRSWRKEALLLGDPIYEGAPPPDGDLALRAAAALGSHRIARLKSSRLEVQAIAGDLLEDDEISAGARILQLERSSSLEGRRFDLFLGAQASKQRLQGDLRGYRILHLAAHGYFDVEYPWFSGLLLSCGEGDAASGFLSLLEISQLELDAEIVFLSACETARGNLRRGEGIINTARSFLLAGARSVVATQWSISDEVAPVVAREFYRRLFAGDAPAVGLREAKLALIAGRTRNDGDGSVRRGIDQLLPEKAAPRAERESHPSVWAPFVLFGR